MNSLNIKKVLLFLLVALLIISISSVCFAIPDPNEFKGNPGSAEEPIMNVTNLILGVFQVIAVAVAVIMLVILAIKYISAAPSEKGEIKKSAFIYVVGALLLFGGVAVLNILKDAGEEAADLTALVVYETNDVYRA